MFQLSCQALLNYNRNTLPVYKNKHEGLTIY